MTDEHRPFGRWMIETIGVLLFAGAVGAVAAVAGYYGAAGITWLYEAAR